MRATIRLSRRFVFLVRRLYRLKSHLFIVGRFWRLLDLPYAMLGPPKERSRRHQGYALIVVFQTSYQMS